MGWSDIWNGVGELNVNYETFCWKFYELLLGDYNFKNKKVIEFGCGTGLNSVIMAKKGAKLTLLDMSKEALRLAKINLENAGVDAEIINGSVFDYDVENEFDLTHSEGLIEHFTEKQRQDIVDIHAGAAKKGGKVAIIVPHKKNLPYMIGKFIAEKAGTWIYINEHPYTKNELVYRMEKAGLQPGKIIGGESLFSFLWLLCPLFLQSNKLVRKGICAPANERLARLNYNTWLSNRYGRIIGTVGTKAGK